MNDNQITSMAKEQALLPILRQAFRPMFLLGALFSIVSMTLWGLVLAGKLQLNTYHNVMFWHQHEMIFGFVAAIIVGFLLTAVQNWTGTRATHGNPLLVLSLVWLTGRIVMLFGGSLPQLLVALIDIAFLPLAAFLFARIIIKAGQQRNLFFVPILILLTLSNVVMHAGVIFNQFHFISYGSMNAVWLVTIVMVVVSGRVLPMFTANGTQTPKVLPKPWLDKIALGSLWLIFALQFFMLMSSLPDFVMAVLLTVAAFTNGWRLLRLKFWITWRVPLLWSLHIAVAFIPFGLLLFALRFMGFSVSISTAVHALTAGAMGIMILSMMARVSLGHSGRVLQPKAVMSAAFLLIILSALFRVLVGWIMPGYTLPAYSWAIIFWVAAYILYVFVYTPILVKPRADGKPG